MDNHRNASNSPPNFNRNKGNFRKGGERTQSQERYQNKDRKFQPRGDRYQRSEGGYQRSEGGYQRPEGGYKRQEGGFQRPEGGFKRREGGYPPRDDRFGPRRPPRFGAKNDRFQPKGKFAPKGKPAPSWNKEIKIKIVSDLQITDGKHRGKYLQVSAAAKAKPTSRRIREVFFKILFRRIRARRFLDLCAGSGTIGLEAISRGSIVSTFVEKSPKLCSFIRKNMAALEIKEGHGEIFELELLPFLMRMWKRRRYWDVVYLDARHGEATEEVLGYLGRGATIAPGGNLVVEHDAEIFMPERLGCLKRWRVVVQDGTALSFFERR